MFAIHVNSNVVVAVAVAEGYGIAELGGVVVLAEFVDLAGQAWDLRLWLRPGGEGLLRFRWRERGGLGSLRPVVVEVVASVYLRLWLRVSRNLKAIQR